MGNCQIKSSGPGVFRVQLISEADILQHFRTLRSEISNTKTRSSFQFPLAWKVHNKARVIPG
jgi:hypothetical protein